VDLKENLLELRSMLTAEALRNNNYLKQRAKAVLERLKSDPMLHDRYWMEDHALEQVLK